MRIDTFKSLLFSEHDEHVVKVHFAVRGFPVSTRFRVYLADASEDSSFLNCEFETGKSPVYYLSVDVPADIKDLLIRCRDSAGKYQYWERVLPLRDAVNQGVSIEVRRAGFGKELGDAMTRVF